MALTRNDHTQGEQLSAYLDGMLDVAQMRQVAQHLDHCAACRMSLDSLREARTLLRNITAPPSPGPEFWADTFRRLRVETQTAPVSGTLWGHLRRQVSGASRRWAAGVAAAAMLGAVALMPWLIHPAALPPSVPPAISEDSVDMSSLVRAHTASAAREPLSDPDRQTMLSADTDDLEVFNDASAEATGEGGSLAADAAH